MPFKKDRSVPTAEEQLQLVADIRGGQYSISKLAQKHKVSLATVKRYKSSLKQNEEFQVRVKGHRARKVTEPIADFVARSAGQEPGQTRRQLLMKIKCNFGTSLSPGAVTKILRARGYTARKAVPRPAIGKKQAYARVSICQNMLNNRGRYHRKVIYSGQACYHQIPRSTRTYRASRSIAAGEPAEELDQVQVRVFGAIGYNYRSALVVCDEDRLAVDYINTLSESGVLGHIQTHQNANLLFMQDGAATRRSKAALTHLQGCNVTPVPWPAVSSDLNPMENLWQLIRNRLKPGDKQTKETLIAAIRRLWETIPLKETNAMINSCPRRWEAVIEADGGPIEL